MNRHLAESAASLASSLRRLEKLPQAIFEKARDVVVVAIVRKTAAKGNRTHREQAPAIGRHPVNNVRADAAIRSWTSIEDTGQQQFFKGRFERWSMTFGSGNNADKIWRSKIRSGLVDLKSCSTTT